MDSQLNDEPYETIISVKSVGAYRYINCNYQIDGQSLKEFPNKNDDSFDELISFADKQAGKYSLKLSCSDALGAKGVEKEFKFTLNKGLGVELSNISIINSNGRTYQANSNKEFYVDKLSGLGLKFIANKRNLACTYEYGKAGGIVHNIIDFFANLFTDNSQNINTNSNPFEFYDANGITIENSGSYNLDIECKDSSGNEWKETYTLSYKEENELNDFELVLNN